MSTFRIPALALLLLATGASAQVDPVRDPHREGEALGLTDGRLQGLDDGADQGRAQAIVEAYVRAHERALSARPFGNESYSRQVEDDATEDGRLHARPLGLAAGLDQGHARGGQVADDAWALLQGRPPFLSQASGSRPEPPPPPVHDACTPAEGVTLRLPRGRSVDISADELEQGRSRFADAQPDVPFPSRSVLRGRARHEGWADGDDVDAWVDGHRDGFRDAYEDAYEQARRNVTWSSLRSYESDGERDGRAEAARRRACAAFQRGLRIGWDEGFDDGFERGFRESWDASSQRHEDGPVILLEKARLVDASDDGVFEPGEDVALEVSLANAGLVDAEGAVLSWSGQRSLAGNGRIEAGLDAQRRRTQRVELGALDAAAPLAAGAVVELVPLGGAARELTATIGRPATLESITAFLDERDGALALVARSVLRSTASRDVDRGLRLSSAGVGEDVGVLGPGETRDLALILPATPEDLDRLVTGQVRLQAGDAFWMQRDYAATTAMRRAVEIASRLGDEARDEALAVLLRRASREMDALFEEPRSGKKLGDASEIAQLGEALRALPAADAAVVRSAVAAPLLKRAEAKGTPRRVRNFVRDALGATR